MAALVKAELHKDTNQSNVRGNNISEEYFGKVIMAKK